MRALQRRRGHLVRRRDRPLLDQGRQPGVGLRHRRPGRSARSTTRRRRPGAPLSGVDNLTVNPAGEVFVCEDGDDMQICVIEPDGTVAPFLQLTGEAAVGLADRGNELAGAIFDPSHRRLYFSAQRAYGFGAVYEVRGPFHGAGGGVSARAADAARGGTSPVAGAAAARARAGAARARSARAGWRWTCGSATRCRSSRRCARTSSGGCPASAARPRARTPSRWRAARRKGREEMRLHLRVGRRARRAGRARRCCAAAAAHVARAARWHPGVGA